MNRSSRKRRGKTYRFFRSIWRSFKAFYVIVFGLLALLLITIAVVAAFGLRPPKVAADSALVINPSGTLVEQRSADARATVLRGGDLPQQALVKDIVDALALAKEDDRISLVILDLDNLQNGMMSKLTRIADAISDFKASGKEVIAIADSYGQSALYLAAQADEVLLDPEGVALAEGFAMYGLYFKRFLDDNDVSINLFKVGEYKSAAESLVRNDMSPEAKEAWLAILDSWWKNFTEGVEAGRDLRFGSIDNLLQNLPQQLGEAQGNLAQLVLDAGLVDRLMTRTQRQDYLIEKVGEDAETNDYRKISYNRYLRAARKPVEQVAGKIAVITAVGNIIDGKAPAGTIGGDSITALVRKARMDDQVKAIVLRIDSGGGSKAASQMILSELQVAQAAGIPVVASMSSVAGSGGYWIASSADEIWASPDTITGSIGVIGIVPGIDKALSRYGISTDGVATTPIAGASMLRELPAPLVEVIQLTIDAAYEQFLQTVAQGRDMDVDAVDEIARGRIWTGDAALERGLVDELGNIEQAVDSAARLAGIDDFSVWYLQPTVTFEERLLRRLMATISSALPQLGDSLLTQAVSRLAHELDIINQLNDPRNTYLICTDCPVVP